MGNPKFTRHCDYCQTLYTGSGKQFCSNKCSTLSRKGKSISQETKDKISTSHQLNGRLKGKVLSDEHKQKISESGKKVWEDSEYRNKMSEVHKGHVVTEETKEKIRKSNTGLKRPYVSSYNKNREKVKGWHHTEESKQKISSSIKGKNNGMYGKVPTYSKFTIYENGELVIKMRSTWEVLFAKYLDSLNAKWKYESINFELAELGTYTPDFESDGILYEIKGYLHAHSKAKIEKFREMYPERNLVLIDKAKMIELKLI